MNKRELGILTALVVVFLLAYFLNFTDSKIQNAIMKHSTCSVVCAIPHPGLCRPAMFIAGARTTFFSKEAVLRHLSG